ncbi:SDR family oxidoreductase [Mycobacterium sp. 1245852.3]|uniref:SDR family oxidoreductase n=1 Tax=Mycobacterium sp. 1245852.3 TaxID=1856860 RepID=UPI0018D3226E|nr:NAD(P)H-binding protein [Mycobacterium sp. 1245852.3]
MKILATCATGRIGTALVPALIEAGHDVTLLSRSADKVRAISDRASAVEGSMTDYSSMVQALEGIDALILIGTGEMELVGNLITVDAAQKSPTVEHIVYIGGQSPDLMLGVPTVAPKSLTEEVLRRGGKTATLLRPSTFMQIDYEFADAIKAGFYPAPFGDAGVARVDLKDVSAAVVTVLGNPHANGNTYTLCGPENLSGSRIAETWSIGLGREVRYAPLSLDDFEAFVGTVESKALAHSLRRQYEYYQAGVLVATPEELDQFTQLLGYPPRRFEHFVLETAASWAES